MITDVQRSDALTPPNDLIALAAWLDGLIQHFAGHPDAEVRERVSALLNGVDALHRAALERLVALLQAPDARGVWTRVQEDHVIGAVLRLYDLLPQERTASALRVAPPGPRPAAAPAIGKRTLPVVAARVAPRSAVPAAVQWHDVTSVAALPSGALRGYRVAGEAVLLGHAGGHIVAYHDACPDTPLALSVGALEGEEIVCPWHGCRFDVQTGQRLVHQGTALIPFPVEVQGVSVRVAVRGPAGTAPRGDT